MLQQVVVETSSPMTFDIESADPDEILIIESISGLDPADITLFTGDYSRDGGYYQGRRVGRRNPVINFRINPDYANDVEVSDARELLYRTFLEPQALTDGVQVRLVDDRKPDRYFIGYTEKLPSDIFVAKPKAQVSMICVDPYLKSVTPVVGSDPGIVSLPLSYNGSADTGIELTLKVTTATNTIRVAMGGQMMTLSLATNFAVNDVIYINTVIGSRAIKRNGTDVMALLTASSKWLLMNAPSLTVAVDGGVTSDGKVVITNWTYRASWWGI